MAEHKNMMFATFLMESERLAKMAARQDLQLKIAPVGNGRVASVYGEAQQVMILIGEVAAQGEDALWKAAAM
jgi:hypothetical protein